MFDDFLKGNHFEVAIATMSWLWGDMGLECPKMMVLARYSYKVYVYKLSHEWLHHKLMGLRGGARFTGAEQWVKYWLVGQVLCGLRWQTQVKAGLSEAGAGGTLALYGQQRVLTGFAGRRKQTPAGSEQGRTEREQLWQRVGGPEGSADLDEV
jgi:hypothetical protein